MGCPSIYHQLSGYTLVVFQFVYSDLYEQNWFLYFVIGQ